MFKRVNWGRILLIIIIALSIFGVSWFVFPDWARINYGWLILASLALATSLEVAKTLVEFVLHSAPPSNKDSKHDVRPDEGARNINFQNVQAGRDIVTAAGDVVINYSDAHVSKDIVSDASQQVEEDLKRALEVWREGRKDEANALAHQIRAREATWGILTPAVRAKVIRFEARLALSSDAGLSIAKALAQEAENLAPGTKDERLEALITMQEQGPAAALQILFPNPVDIDTLNLRASFLLDMGRTDECLESLRLESFGLMPNAETYRLRAWAALRKGDVPRARVEALNAKKLKSSWVSVQFVVAVTDYWSAISPSIHHEELGLQPIPIQFFMVQCDDESRLRLQAASEAFDRLANNLSNTKAERVHYLLWKLACLANGAEQNHQLQASTVCEQILADDPMNFIAIGWALARHFSVDWTVPERELKIAVAQPTPSVPLVIALLNLYSQTSRAEVALNLLQETRPVFVQQQSEAAWSFWYVRLQLELGNIEEACTFLESLSKDAKSHGAWVQFYLDHARRSGDPTQAIEKLEKAYHETTDAAFLIDGYMLMYQLQRWDYAADHAEVFVREVSTCQSLEIAAVSAFNARRYELCLQLLDSNTKLFPQQRLPHNLRQVRIKCFQALGMLPVAIKVAEDLVSEQATSGNLLNLAQLYFEKGDLQALVITARRLLHRDDLRPEEALHLARYVRWQDKRLALDLWRRVAAGSVADELVVSLIGLGFQLELDEELRPFMARLPELAQKGSNNVWVIDNIHDLVKKFQEYSEHGSHIQQEYFSGRVPVHAVTDLLGHSLIDYFHRQLEANEASPNPIREPSLLARHGGRVLPRIGDARPSWRLNVDITSVLLANHFDLLQIIEETFSPIRIPPDLIPLLVYIKDRLSHHQPSVLSEARKILDFKNRDLIETFELNLALESNNTELVEQLGERWTSLYEYVQARGGYLVDFLPLKKNDLSLTTAVISEAVSARLSNARSVVDALHKHGFLSPDAYTRAIDELGTEGKIPLGVEPPRGAALFFDVGVLRLLTGSDILAPMAQCYHLVLAKDELQALEAALNWQAGLQVTVEWIDDLIGRLSEGIDRGVYERIPITDVAPNDETVQSPSLQSLRTLLVFTPTNNDVIWIDDRYSNGYFLRDHTPVIGINDVLTALVGAKTLSTDKYYDILIRLRAANVRFIPMDAAELLYHLNRAPLLNGAIVETRELNILRRYLAACLLQGNILQKPNSNEAASNPEGENAFLIGSHQAISETLREIWSGSQPLDQREAQANWVMTSLYLDHLGVLHLTERPNLEMDERYILGTSLALLVMNAIDLDATPRADLTSLRRQYFDWLSATTLNSRLEADPLLVRTIAEILKPYLRIVTENASTREQWQAATAVVQVFYEDLPRLIQEEIGRDTEFIANIGYRPVVTIYDLRIQLDIYWRAVAETINGREATIVAVFDGQSSELVTKVVTLEPDFRHNPSFMFHFDHPATGERCLVSNRAFLLLHDSPAIREQALKEERHRFDWPDQMIVERGLAIISIEDPVRRIQEVATWHGLSMVRFYSELPIQLAERGSFHFDEFVPPSAESLLRHFRLNGNVHSSDDFQQSLEIAAQILVQEEGIDVAFKRFAGFPMPLPQSLVASVKALPYDQQRYFFKSILRQPGSILAYFHIAHLCLGASAKVPLFGRLARKILYCLLSEGSRESFESFVAVLRWVNAKFYYWPEAQSWPIYVRLAMVWAHSHHLVGLLQEAGAPADWITNEFSRASRQILAGVWERDSNYWLDVTHPRRIRYETFMLRGLSYALNHNHELLNEWSLQPGLYHLVTRQIDSQQVLNPSIIRDNTQAFNSLNSFLMGDDVQLLEILLSGQDPDVSLPPAQSLVEQAIEALTVDSSNYLSWATIHAVLGELPLYEHLKPAFMAIVRKTDFASLVQRDIWQGLIALETMAAQLVYLETEDWITEIVDQIERIDRHLAKHELSQEVSGTEPSATQDTLLKARSTLFDIALAVSAASIGAGNSVKAAETFAEIVVRLVTAWPSSGEWAKGVIQRLLHGLPVQQSRPLYRVLVWLRAYNR